MGSRPFLLAPATYGSGVAKLSETPHARVIKPFWAQRFANLRLERNGGTLDKLQSCQGIPGLIGVQQEWLRDFLQDYASQSMRMMGALRGFTKSMMESAAENASDNIERMKTQAQDAMGHTSAVMDQPAEQMGHAAQDNSSFVQETQH